MAKNYTVLQNGVEILTNPNLTIRIMRGWEPDCVQNEIREKFEKENSTNSKFLFLSGQEVYQNNIVFIDEALILDLISLHGIKLELIPK